MVGYSNARNLAVMGSPEQTLVCVSMSYNGLSGSESIKSTKAITTSIVVRVLQGGALSAAVV